MVKSHSGLVKQKMNLKYYNLTKSGKEKTEGTLLLEKVE